MAQTKRATPWTRPEELERLGEVFLIRVFELALRTGSDDVPLLEELGQLYTRHGLYEKGLLVDLRLVLLRPDEPGFLYNLACSYALLGRPDAAFRALRKALVKGFRDRRLLLTDPDLDPIRCDPRFAPLTRVLDAPAE